MLPLSSWRRPTWRQTWMYVRFIKIFLNSPNLCYLLVLSFLIVMFRLYDTDGNGVLDKNVSGGNQPGFGLFLKEGQKGLFLCSRRWTASSTKWWMLPNTWAGTLPSSSRSVFFFPLFFTFRCKNILSIKFHHLFSLSRYCLDIIIPRLL